MALVTWDPFRELEDVLSQWSQNGRIVQAGNQNARLTTWRPAANISETDKEYIIKAELPEVKKEDISLNVQDGVITIKGERRYEKQDESEKQHRVESFYGSFSRSFSLPADVDESAIKAESKDGVLTVHLPKVEAPQPKPIEIEVG